MNLSIIKIDISIDPSSYIHATIDEFREKIDTDEKRIVYSIDSGKKCLSGAKWVCVATDEWVLIDFNAYFDKNITSDDASKLITCKKFIGIIDFITSTVYNNTFEVIDND